MINVMKCASSYNLNMDGPVCVGARQFGIWKTVRKKANTQGVDKLLRTVAFWVA